MARNKVKEKTIILVAPDGRTKEFGIQHAERLLDMGSECNGGWTLPDDSEYIYTEENGLRLKANKAGTEKA